MSEDPRIANLNLKLAITSVCTLVTVIAAVLLYLHGCGAPKKTVIETAAPPTSEPPDHVDPPDHDPPPVTPAPPAGCSKTVFADIQPLLQKDCGQCHGAWTTFQGAQGVASAMTQRIALPATDTQHMPPAGSPQPSSDQVTVLQKWVSDGVNDACPDQGKTHGGGQQQVSTLTEDVIVGEMVANATALTSADRPFARYVSLADAINEGITGAALQTWVDAVNKGLNSLNVQTQDLKPVTVVNKATGLLRFDFRDYGLSAQQIAAVEQADQQINIVDNSSKGLVLQSLLNTRKPFWSAQVLLDVAFRNSTVYYKLTNVPATLAKYQQQIGVNLQGDLATLPTGQISFISNVGQITLQKPRMIVRDVAGRSSGAYYYQTFDVLNQQNERNVIINGQLTQIDERNVFVAPLLPGTAAQAGNGIASVENLTQDASETIVQLPNGMQGYALWDGQGKRLDAASPDIVQDNQSQIAPEGKNLHVISSGSTCTRCHNGGIIPMADAILKHVVDNGDQFDSNDVQIVQSVYRSAADNNKTFAADEAQYSQALQKLGVKPGADPQAVVSDHYLGNWSAKQLAAFLWLSPEQLENCINGSPKTKSAIGTILAGTQISFAQIEGNTLKQLISDCRLFQDPIAQ